MILQKAFESIKKDFCGDCLGCDADFTQTGDHEYYCGIAELARCAKENERLKRELKGLKELNDLTVNSDRRTWQEQRDYEAEQNGWIY